MNPLTQVKNTQKINARESAEGISEHGSWHEKYKDSAYINIGLLPFELTEGDLLAIFAQYGEVVDVNLVRDKGTGKSRGFAFLAYEDQRSTVLAVDNLNGARVIGRTIRVDHVANYRRKKEEDEEEEQRKREERGVCYAFQRGECNRGSACKFSHDEQAFSARMPLEFAFLGRMNDISGRPLQGFYIQRNANTGWGKKEDERTWAKRDGQPPLPPWKNAKRPRSGVPTLRHDDAQKDKDEPPLWRAGNSSNNGSQRSHDNGQKDYSHQRHDGR